MNGGHALARAQLVPQPPEADIEVDQNTDTAARLLRCRSETLHRQRRIGRHAHLMFARKFRQSPAAMRVDGGVGHQQVIADL